MTTIIVRVYEDSVGWEEGVLVKFAAYLRDYLEDAFHTHEVIVNARLNQGGATAINADGDLYLEDAVRIAIIEAYEEFSNV